MPELARSHAFSRALDTVGRVFDNKETMPVGNFAQLAHVAHLSIEMNGKNGARLWSNRCFDAGSIQIAGFRFYIYEDRHRARLNDGCGAGNEGHWGGNDFIARAYTQGNQGKMDRPG